MASSRSFAKIITPTAKELSCLRADPLLWEQELDVRPDVARGFEKAAGIRAGRVYWRSDHDHLYALELADLGRGHPSMATVYGFWNRHEPRPPEHEIYDDLFDFVVRVAGVIESIDPAFVEQVIQFARQLRWTPSLGQDGVPLRVGSCCFQGVWCPGFYHASAGSSP